MSRTVHDRAMPGAKPDGTSFSSLMMYIGNTSLDDVPPLTITDWRGSGSVSYGGLTLIWHRCVDITMAMVASPKRSAHRTQRTHA